MFSYEQNILWQNLFCEMMEWKGNNLPQSTWMQSIWRKLDNEESIFSYYFTWHGSCASCSVLLLTYEQLRMWTVFLVQYKYNTFIQPLLSKSHKGAICDLSACQAYWLWLISSVVKGKMNAVWVS